jgi:hypothetical protein
MAVKKRVRNPLEPVRVKKLTTNAMTGDEEMGRYTTPSEKRLRSTIKIKRSKKK